MRIGAKESASNEHEIERLLDCAREGSSEALGQVIAEGRNYLLAVANRELPDELRAKMGPSDLVQESIFEAHRDFARFTGRRRDELLAWLRCILLHNVANARRKYYETAKREIAREVQLEGIDSATGRAVDLTDPAPTPCSIALQHEQAELLDVAIHRLNETDRMVITLRQRDHLPFEEIAQRLQKSVMATRKIWSRAVERLRIELKLDDER